MPWVRLIEATAPAEWATFIQARCDGRIAKPKECGGGQVTSPAGEWLRKMRPAFPVACDNDEHRADTHDAWAYHPHKCKVRKYLFYWPREETRKAA